jgi:hypothetical protein
MEIVKSFISKEDVETIQNYISDIKFNTRDSHVPLHNALYESYNAPFDLHTRGEMPEQILQIFSKYSKNFYEIIDSMFPGEYLPPMFSKHYIGRYNVGTEIGAQFDSTKPENTYKSIIFWNSIVSGGELFFSNLAKKIKLDPGDLLFFVENEDNKYSVEKIISGPLYFSEAWIGKMGQLWMPSAEPYEKIDWDNWEIKGF